MSSVKLCETKIANNRLYFLEKIAATVDDRSPGGLPLQCEFFALEGLSLLLRTVERIRNKFNPGLEIQGVVLTMYDRRNNLSDQVATDVREYMGDKVYDTVIPRNVRMSEAPSYGKPALLYDLRCSGSQAYVRLASEILRRERLKHAA